MNCDRLRRPAGSTVHRTSEPVSAGQRLYGASAAEGVRQAPPYKYAVPYSPPVYAGQGLYGPPYFPSVPPKYGPPGPLGPGPYGAKVDSGPPSGPGMAADLPPPHGHVPRTNTHELRPHRAAG